MKVSDTFEGYTVERRPGVEVELGTLRPDQRVAWGDGKTYHLLLTKLPASPEEEGK